MITIRLYREHHQLTNIINIITNIRLIKLTCFWVYTPHFFVCNIFYVWSSTIPLFGKTLIKSCKELKLMQSNISCRLQTCSYIWLHLYYYNIIDEFVIFKLSTWTRIWTVLRVDLRMNWFHYLFCFGLQFTYDLPRRYCGFNLISDIKLHCFRFISSLFCVYFLD